MTKHPAWLWLPLLLASACAAAETVESPAPELRRVENEEMVFLAVRNTGLGAGNIFKELFQLGAPVCRALRKGAVEITCEGRTLSEGKDFKIDYTWSKIGLGTDSSLKTNDRLLVSYIYALLRIDALVANATGEKSLIVGSSDLTCPLPPKIPDGCKRLANILVNYDGTREQYPVIDTVPPLQTATTKGRIPKTLAKLKLGEPVKIVCWGDSVTTGADASPGNGYPAVLERMLREKFPAAKLEVKMVAVGGSSSPEWLWPKPGSKTDWAFVSAEKPDLVTLEFVNDSYVADKNVFTNLYNEILSRVSKLDAELILITPHFTMPEMMKFPAAERRECRPYVSWLKEFAKRNRLGIADASTRWEHLAAEGLPYITLLKNSINHPDDRGHHIFAEELMANFENTEAKVENTH